MLFLILFLFVAFIDLCLIRCFSEYDREQSDRSQEVFVQNHSKKLSRSSSRDKSNFCIS